MNARNEELVSIPKWEYKHLLRLKRYVSAYHSDEIWECPVCNNYSPESKDCIYCGTRYSDYIQKHL